MDNCKYTEEQMIGAIKFKERLDEVKKKYIYALMCDENISVITKSCYENALNIIEKVEKLYLNTLYELSEDLDIQDIQELRIIFNDNYENVMKKKDNIENKEVLSEILESIEIMQDIADNIGSQCEDLLIENEELKTLLNYENMTDNLDSDDCQD